jgi:SIR2-like domain/HEAT repeats
MALADIAPLLAREREDIVPLIGAGLGVAAGLPSAAVLAATLRERSGCELSAAAGDFGGVCRELEGSIGIEALARLVGGAITPVEPTPTSSLMAIARCPTALILTTNYDDAIERSVAAIGKNPARLCLGDPRIGETPKEGEVFVVHLHGVAEEPETMILTTAQRDELMEDQPYLSRLRALVLGRRVVSLGLRLSAEEPHLRAELRALGRLGGERVPLVILPEGEVDEELSILEGDRLIEFHRTDPSQDYLEVRQCAQLIAPLPTDPTEIIDSRADPVFPPFLPPPLLGPEQLAEADRDPAVTVLMAETEHGSLADLTEVAAAQRALLIAAPGRGKTWALRRLGEMNAGRAVFCDLRDLQPDTGDPERAFARLVGRSGEAFDDRTPRPAREALREGSFIFLLDGLEEATLGDHAGVVSAILAAADEWPQHSYVVATRPTSEAGRLLDAGFARFVIEGSEGWGRRYLRLAGITEEQIAHLFEVAPTIGPQLAIPRYAARIGRELQEETEGVPLASGSFERLMRGERTNLEESANRLGVEVAELLAWARRLAAMIELRGETDAAIEEIAALPGPEGRSSRAACEELVQVALLRDLPDRARFSAQVSQETLCADAILAAEDPIAALTHLAIAEVDGRPVFRDDIEHTLDLVFEGSPAELRRELRGLDALRWARTQGDGDLEAVAEAIDVIRSWHRERRLWIPYSGENQLRGPGEALKFLHGISPASLEALRGELRAECRNEERTVRGNAIEMLGMLPPDEETEAILRDLLADPDDVVRRQAAHIVADFKLAGLGEDLWEAWERESDELAMQAIGLALTEICEEADLPAAIERLRRNRRGWRRISYRLLARLELAAVTDLLASDSLGVEDAGEVLQNRLKSGAPLDAEEAEALGSILVRGGHRGRRGDGDRIGATLTEHPSAVLRGAERAASEDTCFLDLFWAAEFDPEILEAARHGALAKAMGDLLKQIRWRSEAQDQPQPPEPEGPLEEGEERPGPKTLAELLDLLGENDIPNPPSLARLADEPEEVQERVLVLAEQWFPAEPSEMVTYGFEAAVISWVALDRHVGEERCLAILGGGISRYASRVAEWLAGQWEDGWTGAAVERVVALERPYDIALAARAVPNWTPELRDLFIERACRLDDEPLAATVMERLRELSDLEGLRSVCRGGCEGATEQRARLELARLGDEGVQQEILEAILADIEGDPSIARDHEEQWLARVTSPALLPLLGKILRATHRSDDAMVFRRMIEAGIKNVDDPGGLSLYDGLIADPELEGGQFYWYQRDALARSMARREILARIESGHEFLDEML